jgi:hypothetical protein
MFNITDTDSAKYRILFEIAQEYKNELTTTENRMNNTPSERMEARTKYVAIQTLIDRFTSGLEKNTSTNNGF